MFLFLFWREFKVVVFGVFEVVFFWFLWHAGFGGNLCCFLIVFFVFSGGLGMFGGLEGFENGCFAF